MHSRPNIDAAAGFENWLPIQWDSPIPQQHPTPLKLRKSSDCYEFHCLKYPGVATFHSYAEFVHALLLEANPKVVNFVPQPFKLLLNNRPYIPDVYVFTDQRIQVLELKPRGELDEHLKRPLMAFFQEYSMTFDVISNEEVLQQETLALNWLPIVQVVVQANNQGLDTQRQEHQLLERCLACHPIEVADLLDPAQRESQVQLEVALYRLIQRHRITVDLSLKPLDYSTELTPCI
ncbi:MAG: hypothetical protein GY938_20645 [Ketobacter sp.]|nr:hypothetical protein [Ketobacter sp.]